MHIQAKLSLQTQDSKFDSGSMRPVTEIPHNTESLRVSALETFVSMKPVDLCQNGRRTGEPQLYRQAALTTGTGLPPLKNQPQGEYRGYVTSLYMMVHEHRRVTVHSLGPP